MKENNEERQFIKWVVILISLILVAVIMAVLVFVYCPTERPQVREQTETCAIDGNGNEIKNGQVMPERMAFVRTSAPTSDSSVTVTASITPSDAMYSSPEWSLKWTDSSVTGNVSDYVTVSQSASDPLSATLTCKNVFTDRITLTFTVKDYYDNAFTKTCELDYLDRVTGIDYITARYLPGTDYATYSPLPYNPYRNTDPCEIDAFYYGSSASVRYELGSVVLKRSGGTVRESEDEVNLGSMRLQYSVSYNNGWISKVKEFNADITPYINFCEIIESLTEKRQILSASNNFPLVRVRFTFTDWTSSNNSFTMDFKCNYNTGISRVTLSKTGYTF